MTHVLLPFLLLLACRSPDSGDDDTAAVTDTADTAESGETGDATAGGAVTNDVVVAFTTAAQGEGFDVDGDGEIDNAIWALGGMLDPRIAESLTTAQHVVIAQLSGIDDWGDDTSVRIGVLTAEDPDGDGMDNTSGAEAFAGGAQVDADGLVHVATPGALVDGGYTVELATGPLPVGSYELELATGLFVEADVDHRQQSGLLGFGIALDKLQVALAAEGISKEILALLVNLADLDLDGDGTDDGLSMAFRFEAAACTVRQ